MTSGYSKKQTQKLFQDIAAKIKAPYCIYSFAPFSKNPKSMRRWVVPRRLTHESLQLLYQEFRAQVPEGRFNLLVFNPTDQKEMATIDTQLFDKVTDYIQVTKDNKIARLSDWIRFKQFRKSPLWNANVVELQRLLAKRLEKSEIIICDDVADYLFSNNKGLWDIKDFLCLKPRAGQYWFDYRVSKQMKAFNLVSPDSRFIGVDVEVLPAQSYQWLREFRARTGQPVPDVDSEVKQLLNLSIFVGGRSDFGQDVASGPFAICILPLNSNGKLITDPFWFVDKLPPEDIQTQWRAQMLMLIVPALLSIDLMNAKSVELVSDDPSPAAAQAFFDHHKSVLLKRQALKIDAIKQLLASEGKEREVGIQDAIKACQHHFNPPSQEEIFAEHHGSFWWASPPEQPAEPSAEQAAAESAEPAADVFEVSEEISKEATNQE